MSEEMTMNRVGNDLKEWLFAAQRGDFGEARNTAQLVIDNCKHTLVKRRSNTDQDTRDKALVVGILFRGLQDFTALVELTTSHSWDAEPDQVEQAWIMMCDCKERLEYVSHFYRHGIVDWVLDRCSYFRRKIEEVYGRGLYFSPEIRSEEMICNICKDDYRSCEHVAGCIYDGVRCKRLYGGMHIVSSSIVEVPVDLRCRIWPWRCDREKRTIEGQLVVAFSLDDFIDSQV